MYKYCEICNKNVPSSQNAFTRCPTCGFFLYAESIDPKEKDRRKKTSTAFCHTCHEYRYAVPKNIALAAIDQNKSIGIMLAKVQSNSPHYVPDNRYKSGYRTTSAGVNAECLICSAFLFPPLLIPIGIYYYYQQKKQKTEIQQISEKYDVIAQKIQNGNMSHICSKCLNAVNLTDSPELSTSKLSPIIEEQPLEIETTSVKFCTSCGSTLQNGVRFCEQCGSVVDEVAENTSNQPITRQSQVIDQEKPKKNNDYKILAWLPIISFLWGFVVSMIGGKGTSAYQLGLSISSTTVIIAIIYYPILLLIYRKHKKSLTRSVIIKRT
jgi:hypothetical protein